MNTQLLDALRALTAVNIVNVFNAMVASRGREYFYENRVLGFHWDDDRLVVQVQGTIVYHVTLTTLPHTTKVRCSCPVERLCKHGACVLFTIVDLLQKITYSPRERVLLNVLLGNNSAVKPVSKQLAKKEKATLTAHLAMTPSYGHEVYPMFKLRFSDGTSTLPAESFAPNSSMRDLMAPYYLGDAKKEELFYNFLQDKNNKLKMITFGTSHEQVTLPIKCEALPVAPKLILDIVGDQVMVQQVIERADLSLAQQVVQLGQYTVVDLERKTIGVLADLAPWQWSQIVSLALRRESRKLRELYADNVPFPVVSEPFLLPMTRMNSEFPAQYQRGGRPVFLSVVTLKKHGLPTDLHEVTPLAVVHATKNREQGTVSLKLLHNIAGQIVDFSAPLCDVLRHREDLPGWLQTQKRTQMVIEGFFGFIGARKKTVISKLFTETIQKIAATKDANRPVLELRRFYRSFFEGILAEAAERVVVTPVGFYAIERDWHTLWAMYPVLIKICAGKYTLHNRMNEVTLELPVAEFRELFADLYAELAKHNVPILLDGKSVETVTLDVEIDASKYDGSDWFDIAPHILANGVPLTPEQRKVLLESEGGNLSDAACIRLLDPASREIIMMLARLFMRSDAEKTTTDKKEIIHIPRLRILDLLELRQGGARVKLAKQDEVLLESLTNFSSIPKLPVPKGFVGTLRDYQQAGYDWLGFLYQHRFGACLADDMGLGKTIQAITFLGGLAEGIIKSPGAPTAPHLIVVPPTLIFNWHQELNKFYPKLKVFEYIKPVGKKDTQVLPDFTGYDVVLATYDRVRIDIDLLEKYPFHVMICDEAQAIKNIQAARTAAMRRLKSHFALSLTGTPIENHIGEYYSIIDIALPGLLPKYKDFVKNAFAHDASLIKKTKPFILRRTKEAILKELPPKIESDVFLNMAEKQERLYATTVAEVRRAIDQAYATKTSGQARVIALTAILRLRQICISPNLATKDSAQKDISSPKIDYLVETLGSLALEGNAALVFSQFTSCLDLIEEALKAAQLSYFRIDGKTSMPQRKKIVDAFQKGDDPTAILLLSLKTGGVGLNLTRANYVFHIDPWWNPAVENQASDRTHRIGQTQTTFVTRLLMHHTIEEKMMALKATKQKLFQDVMEHTDSKSEVLISKSDFDLLLS